ncbi:MAG: NapC/NirT family cytochrome c [Desulfovibrionaceae bacterium]|nr:NapC/NirT family cytochrome c [Desulfovibrionaceae bacterium]
MQNSSKPKGKWLFGLSVFVLGMVVMMGAGFVVRATDQAAFCASCHTMNEEVWTHRQSTHAQFACNECHAPVSLMTKLPFKARVGMRDIYVTATDSVPNLIHTRTEMKDAIQANCRRCHASTIMNVAMDVKPYCTDCHRSVPHSKQRPIDLRKAADV